MTTAQTTTNPTRPTTWATAKRVGRAVATNQIARFAPQLYVRLTGQTGRGAAAEEGAADVGRYFRDCVDDYLRKLGVPASGAADCLTGKTVMEYGPGDLPGVALLLMGLGATKVYCVDRFPLVNLSAKNAQVVRDLLASSEEPARSRMLRCLTDPADPQAGFDPACIEYRVQPDGLSGLREEVDLVISRAVLEHVNDLPATFADMAQAMRAGGRALHLVDLRSHGLHLSNPLDFLEWSPWLWNTMYSAKGVPNRWRVDRYREIVRSLPVRIDEWTATREAPLEQVRQVRPRLDSRFAALSDEDLACLGFWLVFTRNGAVS